MNITGYNSNKLYSKNIKVFVQINPTTNVNWDNIKISEDKKSLYVRYVQDFSKGYTNREPHYYLFHCDGVLQNKHPDEIYGLVIEDLLER